MDNHQHPPAGAEGSGDIRPYYVFDASPRGENVWNPLQIPRY